jgi:hypothetical protein
VRFDERLAAGNPVEIELVSRAGACERVLNRHRYRRLVARVALDHGREAELGEPSRPRLLGWERPRAALHGRAAADRAAAAALASRTREARLPALLVGAAHETIEAAPMGPLEAPDRFPRRHAPSIAGRLMGRQSLTNPRLHPEQRDEPQDERLSRPNRFAGRIQAGSIAVVLDPDVASVFGSASKNGSAPCRSS